MNSQSHCRACRAFTAALLVSVSSIAGFLTLTANAQLAPAARATREFVEEGVEQVLRRSSKEAAEELTKIGGRAAVRESLEKAAAEGGEGLVRRATAYGVEHGPAAVRAIGRSPAKVVRALDDLAPDLRGPALRAIEREPQALVPLIERHGASALEAAARHPGVGTTIGQKLGSEGLETSARLTTDESIVLARHADDIAALPPAQRSAVLQTLRTNAKGAVAFLERHPNTLLTAAGVTAYLAAKEEILQAPTIAADGTRTGGGIVHTVWHDVFNVVKSPLGMIGTVLVALVAGWALLRLWHTSRRLALKRRAAEARIA
jgi:hypothetical protein